MEFRLLDWGGEVWLVIYEDALLTYALDAA